MGAARCAPGWSTASRIVYRIPWQIVEKARVAQGATGRGKRRPYQIVKKFVEITGGCDR
jgi:hypothetical protein